MWVCAFCALGGVIFADAATLTTRVSPVQKVVELLDELKAKVRCIPSDPAAAAACT